MAVPAKPLVCDQIHLGSMTPLFRTTGMHTRLRIINTGTIAGFTVSIDGATMVVQVDGGNNVQAITREAVGVLYPGERMDVLVQWKEETTGLAWLNVQLDREYGIFIFASPHAV